MSITGSLVGYENNNDIANSKKKRRSILLNNSNNSNHISGSLMGKNCPPSLNSSIANSVATNASSQLSHHHHHSQQQHHHNHHSNHQPPSLPQQQQQHFPQTYMNSKRKHANNYHNMLMHPGAHLDHSNYLHLNSLWSIWYGVLLTLFQGYLAVHGAYRFLGCSLIPWKIEPVAELNLQIVLSGVVFILLPLFFTSAVFKVGNLANDGIKLATGSKERRCSMSPHDGLEEEARGGTLRALWTHGGPTAAFVHIVIAMCLLLPRLLLEARIIENGLLPRDNIWQTELDFIAVNRRSLVVLSVVTAPYQNVSSFDDEEDYYNDTMFTAISSGSSNNINNNLLDTNILSMPGRAGTATVGGRTRFFEVPDLINRESNEDAADNTNNNDYNASVGGERPGASEDDSGGGEVEHISVEQFDSKEFLLAKSFNPQTATATTTTTKAATTSMTTTTTTSTSTTTTTTAIPITIATTTASANINNRAGVHKSYDKSWDKLGTLGKGNSLGGVELAEDDAAVAVTMLPTTTGTARSTTDKTTSATTTLSGATTSAAEAATSTRTTKLTTKTATTTKLTTTASIDSDVPTSATPTIARTPPTRPHHKQQQHHAHSNGKSTRKHHHHHNNNNNNNSSSSSTNSNGGGNRQHHRQRSQHQPHHRRHHNNNNNNSRSEEVRSSRADSRPSKAIDFNHLGESELAGKAAGSDADLLDYGRRALQPKSTSTISTTTRDSNIRIVKPEMLPEIIPSTPVTSNSKIIEIKTKGKRAKRMADDELQVEIEPEYLIGDLPANDSSEYPAPSSAAANSAEDTSASAGAAAQPQSPSAPTGLVRLDGFAGMLQIFFGIEKPIDVAVFDRPPSAEFINLVFALLVWCVRYPAVFWTTTKSFATVFSVQMIAAALDIVFSYIGAANLYKLQVYGEAMPIQNPGLILNGVVTLALFLLSSVLMVASSMIMYLYGHGRLAAKMRDRSLITLKSSETWIYFAHCASLCYVLALAVVKAPLLSDLSATYKSNLHCPTFLSALISVVHLLLWIVIWLGLTAKRRWTFKLPPMDTYGLSKATTQPLLMANRGSLPSAGSGSGSGSVLATEQKCSGGSGGGGGGMISTASSVDGGADDVYWPKLTPSSPKLKVTFNEVTSTCDDVLLIGDQEQNDGKRHSPRGAAICFASAAGEIDDGEYATLRAATAASVVGISMGNMSGGLGGGTTPTGSLGLMSGVRVLHLSEYDELPPPPTQQLISIDVGGNPLVPLAAVSHHSHLAMLADYANCGGGGGGSLVGLVDDNTSEEGKLLACVRDDSVTYASTRDLEPPQSAAATPPPPPPPPPACMNEQASPVQSVCVAGGVGGGRAPQAMPENMQLSSSPEHLVSPLAPVTVTVHTNEAHIASSSTPRCLRRADSGVPNEALTPRSDTTSTTESTTSPPERAPSESSSGVHSGEERDVEVVIRPRAACKPPPKPPQPPIQEEPYGRCTNMRMSSFAADPTRNGSNSATLPMTRSTPEPKYDYATHCSTMPLPLCHSQQQQQNAMAAAGSRGSGNYAATSAHSMQPQQQLPGVSSFRSQYANSAVAMAGANAARMQQQQQQQQPSASMHTTLPNGVRYSNPHFLRRLPHVTKAAESPYGHLGLGAGHHTFSKLLQDPLQHSLANTTIPEDRDSANYSMTSDQDCNLYATAQQLN